MPRTALILGESGRFGKHAAQALARHNWQVRTFNRATDTLSAAARDVDLIVNAWNPPYSKWADQVPGLTRAVIDAAQASGAAVMIPGNVYVFGQDMPPVLTPDTPHRSMHPLGRIRREFEAAYREAGVKTIILRAGDFLDTEASGNWFDQVIAAKIRKGRISYPGPLDRAHAWAYLPDLAEAAAQLANRLDALPPFTEVTFEGFTLSGAEMADALTGALGRQVVARRMNWLPIQIARPFWAEAKHLLEMRYLWQRPHRLDGAALARIVPDLAATPMEDALRKAAAALL